MHHLVRTLPLVGFTLCAKHLLGATPHFLGLQALSKLAPHIEQVSMESNGKGVDINPT